MFICGGAFDGLGKIIERRLDKGSIGFNSQIIEKTDKSEDELFKQVMPEDLTKFGLIPEFIGRVLSLIHILVGISLNLYHI